jgi:hypothetical protein
MNVSEGEGQVEGPDMWDAAQLYAQLRTPVTPTVPQRPMLHNSNQSDMVLSLTTACNMCIRATRARSEQHVHPCHTCQVRATCASVPHVPGQSKPFTNQPNYVANVKID